MPDVGRFREILVVCGAGGRSAGGQGLEPPIQAGSRELQLHGCRYASFVAVGGSGSSKYILASIFLKEYCTFANRETGNVLFLAIIV